MKYGWCYSTGSGRSAFSCVSGKQTRDTLCKEDTGNVFFSELHSKAWGKSDYCTELSATDAECNTASCWDFCC